MQRRYTSHRLQLGHYVVPSVLVEVDDDMTVLNLSAFIEEVANTIFVNGTLYLDSEAYPLYKVAEAVTLEQISLDRLITLLQSASTKLRLSNK